MEKIKNESEIKTINIKLWKYLSENPLCNNKDQSLNLEIRMFSLWEQCPTCKKNKNNKIKKCPTATEMYKYFLKN